MYVALSDLKVRDKSEDFSCVDPGFTRQKNPIAISSDANEH